MIAFEWAPAALIALLIIVEVVGVAIRRRRSQQRGYDIEGAIRRRRRAR